MSIIYKVKFNSSANSLLCSRLNSTEKICILKSTVLADKHCTGTCVRHEIIRAGGYFRRAESRILLQKFVGRNSLFNRFQRNMQWLKIEHLKSSQAKETKCVVKRNAGSDCRVREKSHWGKEKGRIVQNVLQSIWKCAYGGIKMT